MRESVIRKYYEDSESDADYLCEVARRFTPLFPDGVVDVGTGMALLYALQTKSITFEDGFVANDISDLNKIIGHQEAAAVVSAFDVNERPPQWWDDQRFAKNASEDDQEYVRLRARLATIPGVSRVD